MIALDETAQKWRESFITVLEPYPANTPLLLSGGTDSATILAALLSMGRRPACYSFQIGANEHEDVVVSRMMTAHFQLAHEVCVLPRDQEALVGDVRELSKLVKKPVRKTHIQCSQPIMYLAKALKRDGYDTAYIGTGGVVEDNRKGAVMLAEQGEEACRAYRRKNLLEDEGSATEAMRNVSRAVAGVEIVSPYVQDPLASYGLSLDMAEINRPRQKGIALRAFHMFWLANAWYRKNSPLQVNSGLREWHETLLRSDYNQNAWKDVVGVYRDIESGVV